MLKTIGVTSLETLITQAVPKKIRLERPLDLPPAATEAEALAELANKMSANTVLKSFVGLGYHGTDVPPVILRNMFENPAWYTAYTPYQAEISQGRLEMLFNFQTLTAELTGLPVASASLLDEGDGAGRSRRHRLPSPQGKAQAHRLRQQAASADPRRRGNPRGTARL
jgi:glycine dehydrogenase